MGILMPPPPLFLYRYPFCSYASYACNPRARAFQGREDFLRWEAAVELRCALDGVMDQVPRGRSPAVVAASGGAESEQGDEDRGGEGRPCPAPEVDDCLRGGELEEATVVPKKREDGSEDDLGGEERGEGVAEAEESVRAAMDGLEDSIAQFLPGAGEQASGNEVSPTPAGKEHSAPVAIALLCARCLQAHLGTPHPALFSQAPSSVFPGGATGAARLEEEDVEEAFMLRLVKACGGSEARDSAACAATAPSDDERSRQEKRAFTEGVTHSNELREERVVPSSLQQRIYSKACSPQPYSRGGESGTAGEEGEVDRENVAAGRDSFGYNVGKEVPEFLLQLEAGWVLASAVWEGVALLERARDYESAIELLAQLLTTRCVCEGWLSWATYAWASRKGPDELLHTAFGNG